MLFEKPGIKMPRQKKTFGQLVDELIAELNQQGVPDQSDSQNNMPGKLEFMTQKNIWFVNPDDVMKHIPENIDDREPEKMVQLYGKSPLEVLWNEGEKGLKRIEKILKGVCCETEK